MFLKRYILVSATLALQSLQVRKLTNTISPRLQTERRRKFSFFKSNIPSYKSQRLAKAGLWRVGFEPVNWCQSDLRNQSCLDWNNRRLCPRVLQSLAGQDASQLATHSSKTLRPCSCRRASAFCKDSSQRTQPTQTPTRYHLRRGKRKGGWGTAIRFLQWGPLSNTISFPSLTGALMVPETMINNRVPRTRLCILQWSPARNNPLTRPSWGCV